VLVNHRHPCIVIVAEFLVATLQVKPHPFPARSIVGLLHVFFLFVKKGHSNGFVAISDEFDCVGAAAVNLALLLLNALLELSQIDFLVGDGGRNPLESSLYVGQHLQDFGVGSWDERGRVTYTVARISAIVVIFVSTMQKFSGGVQEGGLVVGGECECVFQRGDLVSECGNGCLRPGLAVAQSAFEVADLVVLRAACAFTHFVLQLLQLQQHRTQTLIGLFVTIRVLVIYMSQIVFGLI